VRLLPTGAQSYRTTIITNADSENNEAIELTTESGSTAEHSRALGLTYPTGLYSLSHVALPFPMSDALYGMTPDPTENFGINLGALAPRGERNVLIASLDALLRVSSNPFFPYMVGRIEEGIDARTAGTRNATPASMSLRSSETRDEGAHWSFNDMVAFIRNLIRDQTDSSPAPP
jgi:hypothetical protein